MTTGPDEASSPEHRLRREVEDSFREARRLVYDAPPSQELTEEQKAALDRLRAAELSLEEHRTAQHRRRLDPQLKKSRPHPPVDSTYRSSVTSWSARLRAVDAAVLDGGSRQLAYFGCGVLVCLVLLVLLGAIWWAVALAVVSSALVLLARRIRARRSAPVRADGQVLAPEREDPALPSAGEHV